LGTSGHICNPSYSGGRGSGGSWFEASPASNETLSQKSPSHTHTQKAGGVAQGVGPGFKPPCRKEKKKERKIEDDVN
jgi:hypothetical protein